jgi:hypothetical protein
MLFVKSVSKNPYEVQAEFRVVLDTGIEVVLVIF